MPSVLLTPASGAPFPILSGNPWSGQGSVHPLGGVLFRLAPNSSGSAYISFSGVMASGVSRGAGTSGGTVNSGGFAGGSGGGSGLADGMILGPGDSYFVPAAVFHAASGAFNVFATCDATCSGQARLYFESL